MSDPVVSVVLTSYNQGEWLEESIESVIGQTFSEWELILIDNGSTDGSAEIARRYSDHPRIRVFCHPTNRPVTRILNEGIAAAKGEFFSLLQSDDYYLPEKLEKQVAEFEGLPADYGVVYSNGYFLRPSGKMELDPCGTDEGWVLEALLTKPAFFLPIAPLVRMECLRKFPFDESLFMEGEGIYPKIAIGYRFHPLPEPLVVMREHERNMGKEIDSNLRRSVMMYERIFARPDFPEGLRHLRGPAIGGTYRVGGWQVMRRARDYAKGRGWLVQAVRNHPAALRNPRVVMGLVLGILPRRAADFVMDRLDGILGKPPPLVEGPPSPIEGYVSQ